MKWVCFPKSYSPVSNWPWLRISSQSSLFVIYCLILTAYDWWALPVFLCKLNPIKAHWGKSSWPFSFESSATFPPQADQVLVDLFSSVVARAGGREVGPAGGAPHRLPGYYFTFIFRIASRVKPTLVHHSLIQQMLHDHLLGAMDFVRQFSKCFPSFNNYSLGTWREGNLQRSQTLTHMHTHIGNMHSLYTCWELGKRARQL